MHMRFHPAQGWLSAGCLIILDSQQPVFIVCFTRGHAECFGFAGFRHSRPPAPRRTGKPEALLLEQLHRLVVGLLLVCHAAGCIVARLAAQGQTANCKVSCGTLVMAKSVDSGKRSNLGWFLAVLHKNLPWLCLHGRSGV